MNVQAMVLNKKVLLSVGVIAAMAAAALGATYAAWTDTAVIDDNTIATANVSITASETGNTTSVPSPVSVSNILPGYVAPATTGEFRTLITNDGSVPLKVTMYIDGATGTACPSTKIAYQSSVPSTTTIHYGYYPYSVLTSPEVSYFSFLADINTVGTARPIVDVLAPGATVAVRTVPAFATDAPIEHAGGCTWNQVYYAETV